MRVNQMITRIVITSLLLLQFFSAPVPDARAAEKNKISREEIGQLLTDYVRRRTANLGVEVTVRSFAYNDDLVVSAGKIDYEVIAPTQGEGWGSANLALLVRVNDRLERNLPLRVEVEAMGEVVVTTRPLERGEIIAPMDIALQKRDLGKLSGRICHSLDEALGKRVRLGIRGNSPLRSDALERIPLVKSGQMVTIVLENKVLRLTASGKARNAGAEGETVMVQNVNSMKEMPARVVDANTVKIDF